MSVCVCVNLALFNIGVRLIVANTSEIGPDGVSNTHVRMEE